MGYFFHTFIVGQTTDVTVCFRLVVLLVHLIMGASAGSNLGRWVMLITWRSCSPISCMISAMRSAISPETPVSISSNTMVGSLTAPAIIALMESMTRAISPPEATEETLCNAPFLFAENKKFTVSAPCMPGSLRALSLPGNGHWHAQRNQPRSHLLLHFTGSGSTRLGEDGSLLFHLII